MRHIAFSCVVASLLASAVTAGAADFDAQTGDVKLRSGLVIAQSLDSRDALGTLPMATFGVAIQSGYPTYAAASDGPSFATGNGALEGKGALRVPANRAVLLGDATSLASLAAGRIEMTFFARADGARAAGRIVYARKPIDGPSLQYPLAEIVAIRTGRETSDGWVEYSTGPVDGTVYGAPIAGILFSPESGIASGGSFLVDALEVRRVADAPLATGECKLSTEANDCAKGAVCMEGVCVDSALAYGALPPLATRRDIAARTTTYMMRFEGDRHAVTNGASLEADLAATAAAAETPDAFYRPYFARIGALRAAHTQSPSPRPYSRMAAGATIMVRYYGSELDACVGIAEKDWTPGGGRGYAVYATVDPSPLAVGDVLDTVDGEPIDTWLGRIAGEHGMMAADADSDGALRASYVPAIVLRYGRSLGVQRCAAANACQSFAVDLAAARKNQQNTFEPITCSPRFQLGVDVPQGVDPNAYEAILTSTNGGITTVHTNGEPFEENGAWVATLKQAYDSTQNGLMLVDKRRGDGGGGAALQTWGEVLRRGQSVGIYFVDRIAQSAIDGPPGYMDDLLASCDGLARAGKCSHANLETFVPRAGARPRKTAWLTVLDGSASDMSTTLAKGAEGVRIFGSNRTVGLFGSLNSLGGFLEGWGGGAVQSGDVRDGATNAERVSGAWRSGRGVEPDEIVVQKQSDLVAGRDTMLERARAWLSTP